MLSSEVSILTLDKAYFVIQDMNNPSLQTPVYSICYQL